MRQEALFIETPMPKGCVTCKKLHLRCDERKPACKRCVNSGRSCEGYVCVSTARKPTDVTPESVLEFRQKCLPTREHPKKALIVLPVAEAPHFLLARGLAAPDEVMRILLRTMVSGHAAHETKEQREKKRKEREMSLIKFHEPVGDSFDMSRPEGCPVIRSAFMVQMYRILVDIMMSRTQTSDKAVHGLFVSNSRKK
ncbi:uncharacterized protein LY89DRAFT_56547 [Mollisia scopiformis]|uniref:Zn(2)-C6 fungal-type domain-containing protein n=1 Tax=Mollisia scopiformis TaxID=149040 RepID=A0A194XCR7_MOLSC|nr:uncharacterized protein LY89DRAFT_56547 [Mollisia scopiformis]KUJ17547.1 hypothetical protein LY89DRAFT_56547 [Mollisia scopiformis]